MYFKTDELDHEKSTKIIQIFFSKRSDPDPVQLPVLRIRIGQVIPGSGFTSLFTRSVNGKLLKNMIPYLFTLFLF
jgi:hypothetical protein